MTRTRYIVEARTPDGRLAPLAVEQELRRRHPFLFSRPTFTIDELAHWVSYGQGRDQPSGPAQTFAFLAELGLPARPKTW